MTLKSLCNIYLQHQQAKATSGEITIRHNADQNSCLKMFTNFIGKYRKINERYRLFNFADIQMKAMIWLGLNCGFGCTGCSLLKWSDLDFVNGRAKLARKKTGVPRYLPLWPETIKALGNIPKLSKLVFPASGDPFAVQHLLGHANLKMATRYVQDVSKQTDRVIENSRKYLI